MRRIYAYIVVGTFSVYYSVQITAGNHGRQHLLSEEFSKGRKEKRVEKRKPPPDPHTGFSERNYALSGNFGAIRL